MTEEKAATKKKAAGGTKKVSDKLAAVGAIGQAIGTEVQKVIIGKSHVIDNVMINILSNGNLLFEDYPGLAKTLMTNTFADALGCDFKRVQFTPDLLPADITSSLDRYSATCSCLTRLTVRHRRRKRLCSKPCRSTK